MIAFNLFFYYCPLYPGFHHKYALFDSLRQTREESADMDSQKVKVMVVAPTFESAFQSSICKQLMKYINPQEMALRSLTDKPDEQKVRLTEVLGQSKLTALIAISVRPDQNIVKEFTSRNIPIVLIDEEMEGVSTITVDNLMGGYLAGEYLIKKGRKRIGIVSGKTQVMGGFNAEQRLKGFQKALNAGKLSLPPSYIIEVDHYSREEGLEVMPKLMEKGLDAVFSAAGDTCALGLLIAAKDRGLRVPEDVAIVGFDDVLAARISRPAITTIRQPLEKMAEETYQMAVVHGVEILRKPRRIVFNPELVIRQSA
jgi:DNA-binding LacI/PurR family transcriptional regulator